MRDDLIGKTIAGRFVIEQSLGAGGYGGVFRAVQHGVNRPVALKVLHPHLAEREIAVKRFEREAQLASRIRHPNAVTIYDFGLDGDLLFLVMEFLAGDTLKEFLYQRGAVSPAETARIGYKIAAALDAAHRLGLIHRDLKPSNILMTDVNGVLEPVVIDFGLAKLFEHEGEGVTLTESSMMVGTPGYMSPETVRGLTLDGRADLYSLGIILYELLTGAVPFRGHTPMDTATKHVLEMPAPIGSVVPTPLPPQLEAAVMGLLSKSAEERPASARAVMDLLEPIARLDGDPTQLLSQRHAAALIRPQATASQPQPAAATVTQPSGAHRRASTQLIVPPTQPVAPASTVAPAPVPLPSGADATIAPTRGPGAAALAGPPTAQLLSTPSPTPPAASAPRPSKLPWILAALSLGSLAIVAIVMLVGRDTTSAATPTDADPVAEQPGVVPPADTPGTAPAVVAEASGDAPGTPDGDAVGSDTLVATASDAPAERDDDERAPERSRDDDQRDDDQRDESRRERRRDDDRERDDTRRQEAEAVEQVIADRGDQDSEAEPTDEAEQDHDAEREHDAEDIADDADPPPEAPAAADDPVLPGTLHVRGRPRADLRINGESVGGTPYLNREAAPGTYVIEGSLGGQSDTQTVTVVSGEETDIQFTFIVR